MRYSDENVIQHDFGFPRIVRSVDEEISALQGMLVTLGAIRTMAEKLMRDYPNHETACQAIVDFASDGEGDMRGAIERLEEQAPRRRGRGGAT